MKRKRAAIDKEQISHLLEQATSSAEDPLPVGYLL